MKRSSSEIHAALASLDQEQLRRERRTVDGFAEPGSRVATIVDGQALVDFSSNDYLGLARHPAVGAAMAACAENCGAGSGASHLVTGHGFEHARLEEELAAFTGRERALLFSTGYMANLAVMSALAGRGELVLLDRLSHASLIDGGLLSGARFKRYAHGDPAAAERALELASRTVSSDATTRSDAAELSDAASSPSGVAAVVATDGVFSMDGDVGPIDALARAALRHEAWLVVDDAHGLGVIGAHGRGSLEHFGLDAAAVPVLVGTLGKAFGSFGAFVAGSADLIELLMQKARTYIYTTALPQPVAAASRKALEIAQRESWRRERVLALTARFRAGAKAMGVPMVEPTGFPQQQPLTPIQPIVLGSSEAALAAQRALLEAGFCVVAIRPPTVPRGSARLRVTLSAAHTEAQVDALVEALARVCVRHRGVQNDHERNDVVSQ